MAFHLRQFFKQVFAVDRQPRPVQIHTCQAKLDNALFVQSRFRERPGSFVHALKIRAQCRCECALRRFHSLDSRVAYFYDILHGFLDAEVPCFLPAAFTAWRMAPARLWPCLWFAVSNLLEKVNHTALKLTVIISLFTLSAISLPCISSPVHSQVDPSFEIIWKKGAITKLVWIVQNWQCLPGKGTSRRKYGSCRGPGKQTAKVGHTCLSICGNGNLQCIVARGCCVLVPCQEIGLLSTAGAYRFQDTHSTVQSHALHPSWQ